MERGGRERESLHQYRVRICELTKERNARIVVGAENIEQPGQRLPTFSVFRLGVII